MPLPSANGWANLATRFCAEEVILLLNDVPIIEVAGAACVDMTLRDVPAEWMSGASGENYLAAPLRLLAKPADVHLGGNGGAAAYVMGKLAAHVRLNAPVGQDTLGMLVRGWLADAGVDIITPPGDSTMLAITAATGDGRRLGTLQHPGPPIDWRLSADSDAAWLLVAAFGQVTADDFTKACQAIASYRGTAVLDSGVGWMRDVAPARMHELWRHVDVLIGTVEELAHWTGCTELPAIAEFVLRHGPERVVIKMGAEGAAWQIADGSFAHQPALPIAKPDVSIGAGDGFNGTLIVSLARGESMEQAVTAAQRVAAKVVETGRGVLGWQGTP